MKEFTKKNLKALRIDVNNALVDVAKKHGIELKLGNTNYLTSEANLKLKATIIGAETEEEKAYKFNITWHKDATGDSLPEFGAIFGLGSKRFKIIGWNTRAPKYPINGIEQSSGKTYKFTVDQLKNVRVY